MKKLNDKMRHQTLWQRKYRMWQLEILLNGIDSYAIGTITETKINLNFIMMKKRGGTATFQTILKDDYERL